MKRLQSLKDELKDICDVIQSTPIEKTNDWVQVGRQIEIAKTIEELKNDFESDSPLMLLEAIRFSYSNGFTMPLWAHKKLSEAISLYFENHGIDSLDSFIGISRRKFQKGETEVFNNDVVNMIVFLNKIVGFTLTFSYLLLADRMVEKGIVLKVKRHKSLIDKDGIERIYKNASEDRKTIAQSINLDIFKDTPAHRVFEDDFSDSFKRLCKLGSIVDPKIQKKHLKLYQLFEEKSKLAWHRKDPTILF